jgi:hypothetical protein
MSMGAFVIDIMDAMNIKANTKPRANPQSELILP